MSPASSSEPPAKSGALSLILPAIEWAYGRVIGQGLPGAAGTASFADDYLKANPDTETAIKKLVNWQVAQAGTAGLISGLGGAITLPVSIPANLVSVLYLQLRMIAAIAHLRGYDVQSDKVRGLVIACLVGSSATDILKDVGVQAGTRLTQQALAKLPAGFLLSINKAVGARLAVKAGSTSAVNLSKLVPIMGGLVSGAFDAATTYGIAAAAKAIFVDLSADTEKGAHP